MSIVSPIHIEALGLANLRFFRPPSGGREFPWLSVDDLQACMTLPRDLRRHFKAKMRTGPFRSEMQTVAVESGITNIVPHFVAQGLIEAMADVGRLQPEFYGQYAAAGAKALGKLTDGLHGPELLDYIGAAWKASGGAASEDSV